MIPAQPKAASAASQTTASRGATFRWDDPLRFEDRLTEDERLIRDAARAYAQEKLLPRVIDAYLEEKTDRAISHNHHGRPRPDLGCIGRKPGRAQHVRARK